MINLTPNEQENMRAMGYTPPTEGNVYNAQGGITGGGMTPFGKNPDGSVNFEGGPADKSLIAPTRYPTVTPNPLDSAIEGLDRGVSAQEEEAIRQRHRQEMDAQIQSINAVYNDILAKEKEAGVGRLGQGRAMNARAGLLGSSFGEARTTEIQGKNAKMEQAVQNERLMRLDAVISQANKLADEEIKAERDRAQGNFNTWMAYQQKKQEQLPILLGQMAKAPGGPVTLKDLKEQQPEVYNQMLSNYGSEFAMTLAYDSMKAQKDKINWEKPIIQDGRVTMVGVDSNGNISNVSTVVPGLKPNGNYTIFNGDDGTALLYNKNDGTYTNIGKYTKPTTPKASGWDSKNLFTSQQRAALTAINPNIELWETIGSKIMAGVSLEDIRTALKTGGMDPKLLDNFDRVVNIQNLLSSTQYDAPAGEIDLESIDLGN
jgi:hypothetical protein